MLRDQAVPRFAGSLDYAIKATVTRDE